MCTENRVVQKSPNVVVQLPGNEREDELFDLLHEDKSSVTADLQSKKMQVAGEKKKEAKRDCKKSETVI